MKNIFNNNTLLYKAVNFFLIILMSIYFSFTLFYNLPDNYIKINNLSLINKLNDFIYQEWNFFAPPPKSNSSLVYSFKYENDTIPFLILDPTKIIIRNKSKNAPFNTFEQVLDYQLFGSMSAITEQVTLYSQFIKNKYKNQTDSILTIRAFEYVDSISYNNPQFNTLLNYSKSVLEKKIAKNNNIYVKIDIYEKPIIPFSSFHSLTDLHKNDTILRQVFSSKYHKLIYQ